VLAAAMAATVKIGVFGLFHPAQLDVRAVAGYPLVVEANGESKNVARGETIHLHTRMRASGRAGSMTVFVLSVPGKIQREFFGRLEIKEHGAWLVPVVEMDRETAVASITGSELPAMPAEAMKAQAVAARSFLAAAKGRHEGFDFCDTTHCQFLRGRPAAASRASLAAEATKGIAIEYQGKAVLALYSANCGGHTHSLEESGWSAEVYPYFGVLCPVKGRREGHGVGLCQRGAEEMARRGTTFRDISAHFFPATVLTRLEDAGRTVQ
jgi:peptidoglycan hydrolase-like amidase